MKKKITISGTDYTLADFPFRATSPGPWSLYLLTFPDGMQYVGITHKNPEKRWSKGKGYRTKEIRKIVDSFGWGSIKKEILYENMSRNLAGKMEKMMIAKYKTLWPFGYNHEDGGFTSVHVFGRNSFPVKQIDPNTKKIVMFWRSSKLAEENGKGKEGQKLNSRHIRECANGVKNRKTHGGWTWKRATWDEYATYYKEWEASLPKVIPVIAPQKKTEEAVSARYAEKA